MDAIVLENLRLAPFDVLSEKLDTLNDLGNTVQGHEDCNIGDTSASLQIDETADIINNTEPSSIITATVDHAEEQEIKQFFIVLTIWRWILLNFMVLIWSLMLL